MELTRIRSVSQRAGALGTHDRQSVWFGIFAMALYYKGFRIFAIPRDGGYFARLRKPELPFSRREAPFIETETFRCEVDAVQEAKRMVDGGEP